MMENEVEDGEGEKDDDGRRIWVTLLLKPRKVAYLKSCQRKHSY